MSQDGACAAGRALPLPHATADRPGRSRRLVHTVAEAASATMASGLQRPARSARPGKGMLMPRFFTLPIALSMLALVLGAAPAAAQKVSVQWDHDEDFTAAWRYAFDAKTWDGDGLVNRYVAEAIESELARAGWQEDSANPDVLVVFHIAAERPVQIDRWGYTWRWGQEEPTAIIRRGTLIIGLVKTADDDLIWWGRASDALAAQPDQERVQRVVRKMFEDFPPGAKRPER